MQFALFRLISGASSYLTIDVMAQPRCRYSTKNRYHCETPYFAASFYGIYVEVWNERSTKALVRVELFIGNHKRLSWQMIQCTVCTDLTMHTHLVGPPDHQSKWRTHNQTPYPNPFFYTHLNGTGHWMTVENLFDIKPWNLWATDQGIGMMWWTWDLTKR